MCIFTNDKDIPSYVRLATRSLQYLVVPLLSIAILIVGSRHLDDCPAQPYIPIWHIVAGCSGILLPVLYILFDKLNPSLASRYPVFSELLDNAIVFIIPVYILFEVAWLITGTVWILTGDEEKVCDETIYIFSVVVIINFWIHVLTPLVFFLGVCCSRIFPFIGYVTYWKVIKNAIDLWTFRTRFLISVVVSVPLSCTMITVGANGLTSCKPQQKIVDSVLLNSTDNSTASGEERLFDLGYKNLPVWLMTAGALLLILPVMYSVYDKFCKQSSAQLNTSPLQPGCRRMSKFVVILYLLSCMAWALVGFLWIFGTHNKETCNHESNTYKFAFASLILLNILMDAWICIKICIVLYWSLLSEDI